MISTKYILFYRKTSFELNKNILVLSLTEINYIYVFFYEYYKLTFLYCYNHHIAL